ncbi:MAG: hypothetical protein IJC56_00240 [Clostridia bacterium]|nr:hypothetical protein [Clostridia bacterium]
MKGRFMTGLAAISLCALMLLAGWSVFAPAEEIAFPEKPIYRAAEFVYVTPSGSKFHRNGCVSVENSKQLECLKREDAVQNGYEACMKCEP